MTTSADSRPLKLLVMEGDGCGDIRNGFTLFRKSDAAINHRHPYHFHAESAVLLRPVMAQYHHGKPTRRWSLAGFCQ
jgi:hypothetical protein